MNAAFHHFKLHEYILQSGVISYMYIQGTKYNLSIDMMHFLAFKYCCLCINNSEKELNGRKEEKANAMQTKSDMQSDDGVPNLRYIVRDVSFPLLFFH